jgi:hypothetical protein
MTRIVHARPPNRYRPKRALQEGHRYQSRFPIELTKTMRWRQRRRISILCPSKPDIPTDKRWRIPMKNLFFAALAALSLGVAVVPAYAHDFHNGSTVVGDRSATLMQQTGTGY